MRNRIPLDILFDTGAGGGNYMSVALWSTLKKWEVVRRQLNSKGKGALQAANPSNSKIPPMRVLGSSVVPIVFAPEDKVRNVAVRVVEGLPYGFIIGAGFFRANASVLDFGVGRGFKPTHSSPWVPFSRHPTKPTHTPPVVDAVENSAWDHFCQLSALADNDDLAEQCPPPLPIAAALPSFDIIAWEDDSTLQWKVRLVDDVTIEGFVGVAVEGFVTGPQPQDRQLVIIQPLDKYDMETGAEVGVARGVQWWEPGTPVYCKIVNRSNTRGKVLRGHPIARMIAVNVRDSARFQSLFDANPSTVEPSVPPLKPQTVDENGTDNTPVECVKTENANLGQLSVDQKQQLGDVLQEYIDAGLFPSDPKHVPACLNGELTLPLIDESCRPVAAKQRRFSPEETLMIREEIQKMLDRGIIRPSTSPWAAQCLCVKKKDGTLRLCVDWRALNSLLVSDSGGLGDMQSIFDSLKGKRYFTQIDLASGFNQMRIAEKDKHKTAFRDADAMLFECERAGYGLTVLPAAFTRTVKTAISPPDPDVASWLDDI